MPRLADVILRGTRSAQPAANSVAEGAIYYVTDENLTERSNGSAWQTYNDASGASTDHGLLTGLSDDDHPQYLLASAVGSRVEFANFYDSVDANTTQEPWEFILPGTGISVTIEGDSGSAVRLAVDASVVVTTDSANWVDLTDGGTTTLHSHSGGAYDSTVPTSQSDFIEADDTNEDVTDLIQAGSNITITELGTRGAISIASTGGASATETRRIPIQIRSPQTASNAGNAFFNVQALTNQDFGCWEFVKDVTGNVFGVVGVPPEASSPSAKIILILAANATSGVTTMNVSTKCVADDAESINVSFSADTEQDITVPGTAYLTKKVTFTAGDLANAAANDIIFVQIQHHGTAANDTLAVNTLLVDAYLEVDVTPA